MAKIIDYRIQTANPDATATNVVGVFANTSGVLVKIDAAGATREVAASYTPSSVVTGALSRAVVTGSSVGTPGSEISGFIGRSGIYMGLPDAFIKISASGSTDFLIPVYKSV